MKRIVVSMLLLVFGVSLGASALTGSGDSLPARLETVQPTVQTVAALSANSLSVTFSEPMRAPGVTTPASYAVSGPGRGTLVPNPTGATGTGPYTLAWSVGEMRDGASITITVLGVQDAAGNPISLTANSAQCSGKGIAPVFSSLAADPVQAAIGETVTITLHSSEPLNGEPELTVNGEAATLVGGVGNTYTFTYSVQDTDALGMAAVAVSGSDLAGNFGALNSGAALEIVKGDAGLPLYTWPTAFAFLLALTLIARRFGKSPFEGGGPKGRGMLSVAGQGRRDACGTEGQGRRDACGTEGQGRRDACGTYRRRPGGLVLGPLHRAGGAEDRANGTGDAVVKSPFEGGAAKRRGMWFFLALCVLGALACPSAFAAAPSVSNVSFTQSSNGSGGTKVDIYYTLVAPNGPCGITVSLSKNGGLDGFSFPVTSVTGDVAGVTDGADKLIVWDIAADYPDQDIPQASIRLTADDSVVQHALTYTAGPNGTLSGTAPISPQIVNHGGNGTAVTAVADSGYLFSQWSDGVLTASRTDTNVTANITVTASFIALPAPVVTSFAINSGAETTMPLGVTLNNTATNSPAQYMASESAAFTGAVWTAYGTAPAFTLSGGVGTRTVWFKVRNAALVESGAVSDTMFLVPQTVSVAAGTFPVGRLASGANDDRTYGSTNEDPVHSVTLAAYSLGKYLVTNKEYCDVLNWALAQGYLKTSAGAAWAGTGSIYAGGNLQIILNFEDSYCNIQYSGGVFSSKTRVGLLGTTNYSMDTHPVEDVSWYGSVAFCNWLSQWQGLTPCYDMTTANWPLTVAPPTSGGYRLPTEAEWERAAAWDGTKHWIYGFMSDANSGPGSNNRCNDYWYNGSAYAYVNPLGLTGYPYTSPVGWFNGVNVSPNGTVTTVNSPSPVGAYDMSSNVWEWCGDWYGSYGAGAQTNPTGPGTGAVRVSRGGCWGDLFHFGRSAFRYYFTPTDTFGSIGFRLSRSN